MVSFYETEYTPSVGELCGRPGLQTQKYGKMKKIDFSSL
jgi:hypothetical protein